MNEKSYEIAVDVADLAYPLEIERQIILRSRLVAVCGKEALRMVFTIEGRKKGRFGSACKFIDLPEGALLPDGDPVYYKMLEAFCKLWDREREDDRTEWLRFSVSLMVLDIFKQYKDVFNIQVKGQE